MKLKHFFLIGACSVVIVFSMSFLVAEAQSVSKNVSKSATTISFPIAELGNCGSINECKTYCDDLSNVDACLDYALKNDLMPKEQVKVIKNEKVTDGPGGCSDKKSCEAYCDKTENFDECVAFAEKNNVIPAEELKLIKRIGPNVAGPGGCKGKNECKTYCDNPDNQEECLAFAEKYELLSKSEIANIKKMGPMKKGPGGCKGKKECDNYCGNPVNADECVAFAEKNGLVSADEAKKMKKFVPNAEGPGGCKGKDECKTFCDNPDNQETCLAFAEKYELMSKEEIAQAKKMGPLKKGPGGCSGKEECDAFCGKQENQETCVNFSVEHGLMSKEQAEMMKRGPSVKGGPGGCQGKEECDSFCQKPENMNTCVDFSVENGFMSKDEADRIKQGALPITPNGNCKEKDGNCPAMDAPGTPFNEKDCEGDDCSLKKDFNSQNQPQPNGMMKKIKNGMGMFKKFITPDDPDIVPNCKGDECKITLEQVEDEGQGEDGQATQQIQSSNIDLEQPQGTMQKIKDGMGKFKKFISSDDPDFVPNCKGDECKIKLEQFEDEGVGEGGQPSSAGKQGGNSEGGQAEKPTQPSNSKFGQPNKQVLPLKPYNKIPSGDPALAPNCQGNDCKTNIKSMEQPEFNNKAQFPKNEQSPENKLSKTEQ